MHCVVFHHSVIKTNGLQVFFKVSIITMIVKCIVSHSFYIWLEYYYSQYQLLFMLYILFVYLNDRVYVICAAISIFFIYSHISFYTKSEVRLIYALLKIIPLCLLFSISSSILICSLMGLSIITIGLLTRHLKWNNLYLLLSGILSIELRSVKSSTVV